MDNSNRDDFSASVNENANAENVKDGEKEVNSIEKTAKEKKNEKREYLRTVRPRTPRADAYGGGAAVSKEKLAIMFAMFAFAFVLLAVVLVITLCVKHKHEYDLTLDYIDGKFCVVGECTSNTCEEVYSETSPADAKIEKIQSTCASEGKIVCSVERFGELLTKEVSLPKTSHKIGGVDVAELMDDNGALTYGLAGVSVDEISECEKTYDGYYTCSECEAKVEAKVFVPHIFEETYALNGDKVEFVRLCTNGVCGEAIVKDITAEVTFKDEKAPTCKKNGSKEYYYDNKTISVPIPTVSGNHIFKGEIYTKFLNADGTIDYSLGGIYPADPTDPEHKKLICGAVIMACFNCIECNKPVNVKASLPEHNYTAQVTKNPSLTEGGEASVKCSNAFCKEEAKAITLEKIVIGNNAVIIEEENESHGGKVEYTYSTEHGEFKAEIAIAKVCREHKYVYTLSHNDGHFLLKTECGNSYCTSEPKVDEVTESVKETGRIPQTCGVGEKITYSYDIGGETVTIVVTNGIGTGEHILNGVVYKTLLNEDGTIDFTTPGIRLPSSSTFKCGQTVDAYFTCSSCGKLREVKTVLPTHNYELASLALAPTWEDTGSAVISCKNSFCSDKNMSVTLPKISVGENSVVLEHGNDVHGGIIGYTYVINDIPLTFNITLEKRECVTHTYVYELEVKEDVVILVTKCDKPWCSEMSKVDVTDTGRVTVSDKDAPTCTKSGTKLYKYVYGDIVAETVVDTNITKSGEHVIAGQIYKSLLNSEGKIFVEIPGVKAFEPYEYGDDNINAYFECEHCGELVLVYAYSLVHFGELKEITRQPSMSTEGEAVFVCGNPNCAGDEFTVTLPAVALGGNATIIAVSNGVHGGVVRYVYNTDFGVKIEIDIELPL